MRTLTSGPQKIRLFGHAPAFDSNLPEAPNFEEVLRITTQGVNCAGFANIVLRGLGLCTPKLARTPSTPAATYEYHAVTDLIGRPTHGVDLSKLKGVFVLVRYSFDKRPQGDPQAAIQDYGHIAFLVDGTVMSFGWGGLEIRPIEFSRYPLPYDAMFSLEEYIHRQSEMTRLSDPVLRG